MKNENGVCFSIRCFVKNVKKKLGNCVQAKAFWYKLLILGELDPTLYYAGYLQYCWFFAEYHLGLFSSRGAQNIWWPGQLYKLNSIYQSGLLPVRFFTLPQIVK